MASKAAALLSRSHPLLHKALNPNPSSLRAISTFPPLCQQPQFQESPVPLPSNPSTGTPFYHEDWRTPSVAPGGGGGSLVPIGIPAAAAPRMMAFSQTLDSASLTNVFADWMTSQRWSDLKQLFEFWTRSLDASGKPNKPDVSLCNHYLRANLMMGASAGELLDLVAQMQEYQIDPNTASYNLVLKAMFQAEECEAAEKLLDRSGRRKKERKLKRRHFCTRM